VGVKKAWAASCASLRETMRRDAADARAAAREDLDIDAHIARLVSLWRAGRPVVVFACRYWLLHTGPLSKHPHTTPHHTTPHHTTPHHTTPHHTTSQTAEIAEVDAEAARVRAAAEQLEADAAATRAAEAAARDRVAVAAAKAAALEQKLSSAAARNVELSREREAAVMRVEALQAEVERRKQEILAVMHDAEAADAEADALELAHHQRHVAARSATCAAAPPLGPFAAVHKTCNTGIVNSNTSGGIAPASASMPRLLTQLPAPPTQQQLLLKQQHPANALIYDVRPAPGARPVLPMARGGEAQPHGYPAPPGGSRSHEKPQQNMSRTAMPSPLPPPPPSPAYAPPRGKPAPTAAAYPPAGGAGAGAPPPPLPLRQTLPRGIAAMHPPRPQSAQGSNNKRN
jgi:hypothetical protein